MDQNAVHVKLFAVSGSVSIELVCNNN